MRVITGTLKGRKLSSVPGLATRPTSDKIKEATFHIMGPYFQGGNVLDLFAGSGSLGIEAISRGMDQAIFIDSAQSAIQTIKKNLQQLHIENKGIVYRNDAIRALKFLSKKNKKFDLILIDPPYDYANYDEILEQIDEFSIANEQALVYIEYDSSTRFQYNQKKFQQIYQKEFSKTISVLILQYTYQ